MSSKKSYLGVLCGILAMVGVVNSQPTPIPTTGDAPCQDEPTGAGLNDTVVSSPDDSGYYKLFDGTFKGWWHSCLTGHSSGGQGGIFRIGSSGTEPAIFTENRDENIGGILMTKKKFTNYEIVFDMWPDFNNDAGLFNRTDAKGKCFQTVLDYYDGASVGGTWGEGGYNSGAGGRDIRPWKYEGNENTISIPGGADGWTAITQKLNPTSFGCPTSGCTQTEYRLLWDQNGWNQMRIQFYGAHAAGTGNVHMKSWFRKVGATAWVPILQDTTLALLTPPGYIGIQVHGGNRFKGNKGTWYKNIKWRPMTDKGVVIAPTPTSSMGSKKAQKLNFSVKATENALVGAIDADYQIVVQDLKGKTLESFGGNAGSFRHTFKTHATGVLSIQIVTPKGIKSSRVFRSTI